MDGFTSVTFERDEMKFIVNNTPAHVCPSCGDAYVGEDVAVRLVRDAEEMSTAGMMDEVVEYDSKMSP